MLFRIGMCVLASCRRSDCKCKNGRCFCAMLRDGDLILRKAWVASIEIQFHHANRIRRSWAMMLNTFTHTDISAHSNAHWHNGTFQSMSVTTFETTATCTNIQCNPKSNLLFCLVFIVFLRKAAWYWIAYVDFSYFAFERPILISSKRFQCKHTHTSIRRMHRRI